jgi:hypothetical protein
MVSSLIDEQKRRLPQGEALEKAIQLLRGLMTARDFPEFLTLASYDLLD